MNPVAPGQRLAHYELIEKIGAGGMGEVWRAVDTLLDREVAIKLLPHEFAADPDRLARFKREARLLASLNHGNIAAIHGLEESNGVRFLALELVPGETLAEIVQAGALPAEDATGIAVQLASGLEAAHEARIIHRDLKPANVKVTPDGTVKILDFGIAKATRATPDSPETPQPSDQDPTITTDETREGLILGTVAYMSPEQARGRPVDKRTDVWSYGCVLYELLTGVRCFAGETASDTLARVLERDPDWSTLPNDTPRTVRDLLRRCLEKDPRRRLRDVGEARIAIEDLDAGVGSGDFETAPGEGAHPKAWRRALPWTLTFVAASALLTIAWMSPHPAPPPASPSARLSVSLPRQQQLEMGVAHPLAISPDGSRLVYVASRDDKERQLYTRTLDRFVVDPIAGTEGAEGPFFSPDGKWIAYYAENKLYRVSVRGGPPLKICDVGQVNPGGTWGPDGEIIFSLSPSDGLARVPATGGTPRLLTTPDVEQDEVGHGWPHLLPGGDNLLFTIASPEGSSIAVLSLETGEWRALTKGVGGARYLPTGHLIFARAGGLMAVPFDPERLETLGSPFPILEDVHTTPGLKMFGFSAFSISDTGVLAYVPGGSIAGENRLVWVDRQGKVEALTSRPGNYEWPRLSPDGTRIAVTDRSDVGRVDIWILDVERESLRRLTLEGSNILPAWTPDGTEILFGSHRSDSRVVSGYRKAADGSGVARKILGGDYPTFPHSCSANGKLVAFVEWPADRLRDIWVARLDGEGDPERLIDTPFDEHTPMISPDGRWLAYVSDESGRFEVFVRPFPDGDGKWLISTGGGSSPVWSRDGQELFYRNGNVMMSAAVETEGGFHAEKPAPLFEGEFKPGVYGSLSYDVSADGRRFVMIQPSEHRTADRIHVVLNWSVEDYSSGRVSR